MAELKWLPETLDDMERLFASGCRITSGMTRAERLGYTLT